jgi:predicted  nucleic acid-binding Zn-ribbon protein
MMGLSQLWQLQEMQLRQQELQHELQSSTLAKELKGEKLRLEALQAEITDRGRELERLKREIAALEQDYQGLQDKRKKTEGNLYGGTINNPKELKNLQTQVENTDQELSRQEERLVELTLKIEQLEEWMALNNNRLHNDKVVYRSKLAHYRTWRENIKQEIDVLAVTVNQLTEEIEPELFRFFSDLQRRLGIKALARTVKGSCSGCNLIIPPMLLVEIRAGKRIYCENCGRLILP